MTAVVLFLARGHARRRWRSLLLVALLTSVTATIVITTTAGARRTATALDRFAEETAARHIRVEVHDPALTERVLSAIEGLDEIEVSGRLDLFPVRPADEQAGNADLELAVFASPDGRTFRDIGRSRVLEGRRPDPSDPHEAEVNYFAHRELGLQVGDRVTVRTHRRGDLAEIWRGDAVPELNGPVVTFEITAITRTAEELQTSPLQSSPAIRATPAFYRRYGSRMDGFGVGLLARLQRGEADVPAVRAAIRSAAGPSAQVFVQTASTEYAIQTGQATDALATTLAVVSAIAAMTGALTLGGAISRHTAGAAGNDAVLQALGLDRRARAISIALPVLGAVTCGAVVGGLVAIAASPLTPIGLARLAEPEPGFAVDGPVVVAGAAAATLLGGTWAFATALWTLRPRRSAPPRSRSRVALAATRAGMGVVTVQAVRRTFGDDGSRQQALLARSSLTVAAIAFAGVVGTAVVTDNLRSLAGDPERYGWAWSAELEVENPEPVLSRLISDDRLEAVALANSALVELGRSDVTAMSITAVSGELRGVVREGRHPTGPDEIALGAETARRLGVDIGDTVELPAAPGGAPAVLRVVGVAVIRPGDVGLLRHFEPGEGALLTEDGLAAVAPTGSVPSILVRYPEGADVEDYEEVLSAEHGVQFSVYSYPVLPARLQNLQGTVPVIRTLGLFFAILVLGTVGHAVASSVRRRHREHAILRSLGLRRRQIRVITTLHAVSVSILGAIVGGILGLAVGRTVSAWLLDDLGVVDHLTLPLLAIGAILLGAVVLAAALAQLPLRSALVANPGQVLRPS